MMSRGIKKISDEDKKYFKPSLFCNDWLSYRPSPLTINEDLEFLKKFTQSKIIIDYSLLNKYNLSGFSQDSKSFLKPLSKFRGLNICTSFSIIDIIQDCKQLEYLGLSDLAMPLESEQVDVNLDFSNFDKLKYLSLPIVCRDNENYEFQKCSSLEYLHWSNAYKANSSFISSLGEIRNLKVLMMHRAKFKALDGINHLTNLEYLQIDYSRTLKDFSDLSRCKKLIGLELQNCSNVEDLSVLKEMKTLKVLDLKRCNQVQSLKFLKDTSIEYLDIYDSKIVDGDLSFIDDLPNLKFLRFDGKRHYNRKPKDYAHFPCGIRPWDYHKENFT